MNRLTRVGVFVVLALVVREPGAAAQNLAVSLFERYLEPLRVQAAIPGLSAAIVQDGVVVWDRGFGQADLEKAIPARADTPYHIGDLTQTLSTVLLAQCAEQGWVQPDDPIRRWVPTAPEPPATLRQLLSHVAGPTGAFQYDPARFALLTPVVATCARLPYRQTLARWILDRLAMVDAVPGRDLPAPVQGVEPLFDAATIQRYAAVLERAAAPYKVDRRGRASRSELPPSTIDAAGGVIASVRDLARFDAALDQHVLVRADTLAQTWANTVVNGAPVPTTMGWFAQTYEGQRIVWHFGLIPDSYSGLILKVPARRLTLILLANSDGLSAPFALSNGDVTSSVFARTFLRLFL